MKDVTDRSATEHRDAELVAVVGGTIIDGNGGAPIDEGRILINGKRIQAVGDHSMPVPLDAKQIRATGKFVIPGLMCPNQVLVDANWPTETIRYEGRYDEVAIEAAQLALRGGVTTVFDTLGPRDSLIKARNAINEGRATGARIYLCGNWIGLRGPYSVDTGPYSLNVRPDPKEALGEPLVARINAQWETEVGERLPWIPIEEVRQEVRKFVQSGIDFVQYPVNIQQGGTFQLITFSPRVQRMIVEEAHRSGLVAVATFATNDEGIHLALDAGVDMVAPFPWGGRPMSAETVARITQMGTPVNIQVFPTQALEWYRRPPQNGLVSRAALEMHEAAELDHRALIQEGAPLVVSAYSAMLSADQLQSCSQRGPPGIYVQLGEGHVRGLQALQEKGVKAMDALMTHTRNVARAYKVDKDLGTLDSGKLADLIVLNANPLEDPRNYLNIHLVMKEGRVIDREALPTQRLWSAAPLGSN